MPHDVPPTRHPLPPLPQNALGAGAWLSEIREAFAALPSARRWADVERIYPLHSPDEAVHLGYNLVAAMHDTASITLTPSDGTLTVRMAGNGFARPATPRGPSIRPAFRPPELGRHPLA